MPSLADYRTLGRSGLVICLMALGTMTFDTPRRGSPDEVSEAVFDAYIEAGGNFVDTADVYAKGRGEELVGGYIAARGLRDKVVLATKPTFSVLPGDPNGGGNGRKHMFAAHAAPGPVAVQMEYSLTERCVEWEHAHAARDCGLGITPWSPLAGGFLAGKYAREAKRASGESRLAGASPFGDSKFTDRNWRTLDARKAVAAEVGRARPGVTSTILGASKVEQLADNIASLGLDLVPEQPAALDAADAPEASFYAFFQPGLVNKYVFNAGVQGWR